MNTQTTTWPQLLQEQERERWQLIYATWLRCGKNQTKTAELLNMQRTQVWRMFAKWHK